MEGYLEVFFFRFEILLFFKCMFFQILDKDCFQGRNGLGVGGLLRDFSWIYDVYFFFFNKS